MTRPQPVPPDGGWGWVVVFGVAICNATTQSLLSVFGLLFADMFVALNEATTGAAVVGNSMVAVTNFTGLIVSPVMRRFSYRQVSLAGGLFVAGGMFITGYASTMWHLLLCYSLLVGVGLGLIMPSTFVAVNTYFSNARGRAVGLSLAGTGIGQMLMPHLVRFLLEYYSFRGAVIILSGVALHSLPSAMLFRPLKGHAKPDPVPDASEAPAGTDTGAPNSTEMTPLRALPVPAPEGEVNTEDEGKMVEETTVPAAPTAAAPETTLRRNGYIMATVDLHQAGESDGEKDTAPTLGGKSTQQPLLAPLSSAARAARAFVRSSLRSSSHRSSRRSSRSSSRPPTPLRSVVVGGDQTTVVGAADALLAEAVAEKENGGVRGAADELGKSPGRNWPRWAKAMDLDLLADPITANLLSGLAAVYTSGVTFNMLLPFFLADSNMDRPQVAMCMSVQAALDILSRLVLPPFTDKARIPAKLTFLVGSLALAGSRSLLAMMSDYTAMLTTSALVGFVRGSTTVTLNLAISESCDPERLPGALGLSMVLKGISSLAVGLLVGWLRDYTSSYTLCIHVLSLVTVVPMVIWIIEMIVDKRQRRWRR